MITIGEPNDGFDTLEKLLKRELVLSIYRNIICPIGMVDSSDEQALPKTKMALKNLQNAFIFMAINESGYTQEEVASMFSITQPAVRKRFVNTVTRVRERGLEG